MFKQEILTCSNKRYCHDHTTDQIPARIKLDSARDHKFKSYMRQIIHET